MEDPKKPIEDDSAFDAEFTEPDDENDSLDDEARNRLDREEDNKKD